MSDRQEEAQDSLPKKQTAPPESKTLVLGVHALTEFMFCESAGLVAYETKKPESVDDPGGTPLDYSPMYDYRAICRQLNRLSDRFWGWIFVGVAILIITPVFMHLVSRLFAFSGAIALASIGIPAWRLLTLIVTLSDRKKEADDATGKKPDVDSLEDETIGWWELHREGFAAATYEEGLVDREAGMMASLSKILRYSDMVIPVFFINGEEIKLQHRVRMAAYCHLIEHGEQARSPYGVLVEKGTHTAHVVKTTKRVKATLAKAMDEAREVIRKNAQGYPPARPEHAGKCTNCPIGRPRSYQPGTTELVLKDRVVPVYVLGRIGRRTVYHSQCGDRFGWKPPHKRVAQLGLKRASE